MNILLTMMIVLLLATAALGGWRSVDRHKDAEAWKRIASLGAPTDSLFDPAIVAELPDPARRYFLYAIQPGTPLRHVVEIEMNGELALGSTDKPNYRSMRARQILAPPFGLVWKLDAGAIAGSDGATPATSWTRFWLFGFIPVVRVGDNADHHRSAFGRVVAEGAFWAPASLLPGEGVSWHAVDDETARAVVSFGDFEQAVEVTVAEDGRPVRVVIERWSNENAEKVFRLQPFGGYLSAFDDFDGYRLPRRVEGGNHMGTDDYFPFYKANVTSVRFPVP